MGAHRIVSKDAKHTIGKTTTRIKVEGIPEEASRDGTVGESDHAQTERISATAKEAR